MHGSTSTRSLSPGDTDYDAVVIGAGFAGLYMLYRLRELGYRARVYEAGDDIGGTWYWNRYPGARCDIESIDYSYAFSPELQQEWTWSERYASQAEILRYINYVADRFDLRSDIQLATRVIAAHYDATSHTWQVATDRGDRVRCRYCITAVGCLSAGQVPKYPGLEAFQGTWYHTGTWPHAGVDFSGQRVGVIGTGSSGIQSIPVIAQQAQELTVFQRTPNYSLPAQHKPVDLEEMQRFKEHYSEHTRALLETPQGITMPDTDYAKMSALEVSAEEREAEYERLWQIGGFGLSGAFADLSSSREANETLAAFVRRKISEIVKDPQVAALLTPTTYPLGAKRLCLDTDYFQTFNLPHVHLVDVRTDPIARITPTGISLHSGRTVALDAIVFATGYDAMTGALYQIDLRGTGGLSLQERWADGPRTWLGLATAGFPNLFLVTGPQSPSIVTNVLVSIEQHVEWIARCLAWLDAHGIAAIEAQPAAEERWGEEVNRAVAQTMYPYADSWYYGANMPDKPRVFAAYTGGVPTYRQICEEVAAKGYEGFTLLEAEH